MAGGGVTSGRSPCAYWPFATSASTLLTVSSVRVELTCSFLVACIAVVAKRKRFSILSPASYTSSDRMIASIPGDGAILIEFRPAGKLWQLSTARAKCKFGCRGIGLRQLASADYSSEASIICDASPSQTNPLSESFSARASAPKPVSLGAFRPVLSSMNDVLLP